MSNAPPEPMSADTEALAAAGMSQAIQHAEAVQSGWGVQAYEMMCAFARQQHEFMTEDARNWAHERGLRKAPSARAWGAVAMRACRDGVIVKAGYRKTQNPTAHGTPATLWASLVYRKAA